MFPNPPDQLLLNTPYPMIKQLLVKIKQNRQGSESIVTGLLTDENIVQQPGVVRNHHSETSPHDEQTH